jgi:oligopeptide/dipeptide ABC transporter ATP-binding protein
VSGPVLRIDDLQVLLRTREGTVRAVNGVSLTAYPGKVLALAGESGCGKSTTVRAVLRVLPPGAQVTGHAWFGEHDLLRLPGSALRRIRGRHIALVFQNAVASLNPTRTVADHFRDTVWAHFGLRSISWRSLAHEALQRAGLTDAGSILSAYPFELSGGQQQRVALALATVLQPAVLLADEITTALDVTTQALVLDQLRAYARTDGLAVVLITHDLAVAARWADELAVMYGGMVVEEGPVKTVLSRPAHPYTALLIACQPRLDSVPHGVPPGGVDSPPEGERCPFLPRCPQVQPRCRTEPRPPLVGDGRRVACYAPCDEAR